MEEFKKKYVEEAHEIITTLEEVILKLEGNEGEMNLIEEIFRSLHTLKGGAAMFGFDSIRDVTHELENIYDKIRSGKNTVSKPLLDITLEAIDYFKNLLEDTGQIKDTVYKEQLIEQIKKITEGKIKEVSPQKEQDQSDKPEITSGKSDDAVAEKEVSEKKNEQGHDSDESEIQTYHIYFHPNKDILKNGTNPLLLLEELGNLGEAEVFPVTISVPPIDQLNIEELHVRWNVLLAVDSSKQEEIRDVFMFVEDDSILHINMLGPENLLKDENIISHLRSVLSTNTEFCFDDLQNILEKNRKTDQDKVSDIPSEEQKEAFFEEEETEEESRDIQQESKTPESQVDELSQRPKTSNGTQTRKAISSIRISAEKIDELMNLVSELVTTQARLNLYTENQQNRSELEEINENIHKLTSQLRDNAFDLSLIPIQSIVTRFQRLVRDLSSSMGKEVDFITEGADTEIDKSIMENLVDPVLHILRNSIDHGIEDASVRKKAGKPAKGTILLKAYYSGANVHIEISDDGKGLDKEEIYQKGIENGLISPHANLSKKQIFDLIFAPGFSTSNSVTDVSGRGVGMDVVKEKISGIRGEVDIDSQPGKSTTMTIKLPLTLSIIDGLLVDINETKYIIPLNVVDKIYAIKHTDLDKSFYNIIELNQQQFPYCYLRQEFGFNESPPENEQVIVVSYEDKQAGIVVDRVIGEYQAVLKPLGKHYRKIQIISGATILGDGSVALVMDTNKIISNFSGQITQKQSESKQQFV
jgi:two-component system, chemotaxis family, sensor kinase CheA